MRKYLLIVVLSIWVGVSAGQSPWKFRSDNYFGFTAGEIGGRGHLQTVNGLYKGPWFLGLGAGLDYYRYRSVPLFVSVTRDLPAFNSRNGLYLYLDAGINLPWYYRDLTDFQKYYVISSKFHSGPWGSAGLGYRWRFSSRSDKGLLLSAGYSVKKLTEKLVGVNSCPSGVCQIQTTTQTYIYDYTNSTLLFLVGFRF